MAKSIVLVCGIALLMYPLWANRNVNVKRRRVYSVIGLTMLFWWCITVWLVSPAGNWRPEGKVAEIALHVKWVMIGVMLGLILGLAIQDELFPSRKKPKEETERKDAAP
jgi:hypothetical protein